MVQLKPSSSAVAEPKPKYGHLSKIDPDFAPFKEAIDQRFKTLWSLSLEDLKAAYKNAPVSFPEGAPQAEKDFQVADQEISVRDGTKIGLRVYRPIQAKPNAILVLKAHGGGWTVGYHQTEEVENRMLAAHAGAVVVSVDYRMGPEYKFPYAVNDCFDALKWCKANATSLGIDPEAIVVAGGSAGGNIAAVLSLMARDQQESGIIGQILNIPVTCHPDVFPRDKYEYGSFEQNKDASVVDAPKMLWFWEQYMPTVTPDVYAHPLLAESHAGLPPALVQVAGLDPLRDEGLAYAEALKNAGVAVTLNVYPGLPHGFYLLPHLEQARRYWQSSVDFVKSLEKRSDKL
ncbi:hypothetical protein A1O3_01012 [Capronia epimyces CBS 606.96]|uniref:Alpha/beta hydrolase fold-3 domain-containing protein n=1 Tax=Capronia epimyces CBS 606.96 TaxID=1182542 RepID=W9YT84_9EURO|nr:uncharacterized protein A1O3_01012 [Capronia epimyces CBS 606.96]EXJ92461.1 hypothetical protein A1O3_01012 [Capronia epimyces CBS 606.96]